MYISGMQLVNFRNFKASFCIIIRAVIRPVLGGNPHEKGD
jgi:hypothetical protein